ncbi:hypothetical protein GW17_00010474 [Ensete ventricosum]|nr:hypothetical protein GW17_00010474 [Ensete ventricosum]
MMYLAVEQRAEHGRGFPLASMDDFRWVNELVSLRDPLPTASSNSPQSHVVQWVYERLAVDVKPARKRGDGHQNEMLQLEEDDTDLVLISSVLLRGRRSSFINIDCGIPENSSYLDQSLGITYVSDAQFIDTGVNHDVSPAYVSDLARRYLTVRSFPDGPRNCYTFKSMTPGLKYLIRATFLYGNYDFENSPSIQFDLYLGVNLWKNIRLTEPTSYFLTEAITEATADLISVCLVNTGRGTPFISGLDLRPMVASLYPLVNASRSLVLLNRFNMAPTDGVNDHFGIPSKVMQTAVYPVNSTKLELSFTPDPGDLNEFYAVMYFAELQQNASRHFSVFLNGALLNDAKPLTPDFLTSDAIYSINPSAGYGELNISLVATESSTLPPLLNAVEVFSTMRNTNVATDGGDGNVLPRLCSWRCFTSLTASVDAMMAIKGLYQVKKNWMGDPCSPKAYTWDGLKCALNASGVPRLTTL